MQDWVYADVVNLIEEYGLHRGSDPVVNLEPLYERFPVEYADIRRLGLRGLILPPRLGWPAHERNRARVLLDTEMLRNHRHEERLVYAHEVGHGLARHIGTVRLRTLNLHGKAEREAWTIASELLIPWWVVTSMGDVRSVAAACEVPQWLVRLRREGHVTGPSPSLSPPNLSC